MKEKVSPTLTTGTSVLYRNPYCHKQYKKLFFELEKYITNALNFFSRV